MNNILTPLFNTLQNTSSTLTTNSLFLKHGRVWSTIKKVEKNEKITNEQLIAEHGKIPPQALDYEEAVIGAMMVEKDALTKLLIFLNQIPFIKIPSKNIRPFKDFSKEVSLSIYLL